MTLFLTAPLLRVSPAPSDAPQTAPPKAQSHAGSCNILVLHGEGLPSLQVNSDILPWACSWGSWPEGLYTLQNIQSSELHIALYLKHLFLKTYGIYFAKMFIVIRLDSG